MTEVVTSGSMSGERKRSDGPFGESGLERRRSRSAPPVLHATAPFLDSTTVSRPVYAHAHVAASSKTQSTRSAACSIHVALTVREHEANAVAWAHRHPCRS